MQNNKVFIIYIIFMVLLFASCNTNESGINGISNCIRVYDYDSIFIENKGMIAGMGIHENTLVIKLEESKYQYMFIDKKTGDFKAEWGSVGKGKNEFLDFGNNFVINDSSLVFMDSNTNNFVYVSLADIIQYHDTVSIYKDEYPYTEDFRPSSFTLLPNDTKITLGFFSEGRFGILDNKNKIMDLTAEYPFDTDDIPNIYKGTVFQGKIASFGNHFAIYTVLSDILEIYQLQKDEVKRIFVSDFKHVPEVTERFGRYNIDHKNCIGGINGMSVNKDYIFLLFSEQNYNVYAEKGFISNEILCYDWAGDKIKKYQLPFDVLYFCVDNERIYCVGEVEDHYVCYIFKM